MPKQHAAESRWADVLNINLVPAVAHLRTTTSPTERRNLATRELLLRRICAEFEEMPGLSVTLAQATKLLGLTPDAGARILSGLIVERVLRMTADRRYVLRTKEFIG